MCISSPDTSTTINSAILPYYRQNVLVSRRQSSELEETGKKEKKKKKKKTAPKLSECGKTLALEIGKDKNLGRKVTGRQSVDVQVDIFKAQHNKSAMWKMSATSSAPVSQVTGPSTVAEVINIVEV